MADTKTRSARINLDVPFMAHKRAKKLNAYYDPKHKVWYTYAGHATAHLLAQYMSDQDRKAYGFDA